MESKIDCEAQVKQHRNKQKAVKYDKKVDGKIPCFRIKEMRRTMTMQQKNNKTEGSQL